jgi:hypothetical protein
MHPRWPISLCSNRRTSWISTQSRAGAEDARRTLMTLVGGKIQDEKGR